MRIKLSWLALLLALSACAKNGEDNALATAQKCLDDVPEGQYSAATACLGPISAYNSQQADILKCAILMTSGGLMEQNIIQAYNALQDKTQTNKAAAFMAVLALTQPDVNTGYTTALQANQYCQSSGVPGLMYIGGIIVAGSYMQKAMLGLGITIDPTNPSSINTAVNSLVSTCGGGGTPPASCTQDISQLGSTVTTLAGSYCSTPGANTNVCGQVTSAVNSAGGSSSAAGQALFCYMNQKTYDPTTGQCQ